MTIEEMQKTIKTELEKAFKGSYDVYESDNGDLFDDDEQFVFEAYLEKNITAAISYNEDDKKWSFRIVVGDLDSNFDMPVQYEGLGNNLSSAIEKAAHLFKEDYEGVAKFYNSIN